MVFVSCSGSFLFYYFLFIYFLFFKTKERNVLFNDALNIDHSDIGFNLCVWGGGVGGG